MRTSFSSRAIIMWNYLPQTFPVLAILTINQSINQSIKTHFYSAIYRMLIHVL